MTDRPIPFSGSMVRAILDGRKSMTRRVLAPQPQLDDYGEPLPKRTPYLRGDLLYVKEAWRTEARFDHLSPRDLPDNAIISYEADYSTEPNDGCRGRYRHARYMMRHMSRITLRVTAVKVERLQDISGADTIAEGVQCSTCEAMKVSACHDSGCFASTQAFRELWISLHGPGSWDANPWVVAYSFERVK